MKNFYLFHSLYTEHSTFVDLTSYKDLPGNLVDTLNFTKETSYSKGFISIVSPSRYRDLLVLWDLEPLACCIFVKFAFGAFVLLHENKFKVLNPVFNTITTLGEENEFDFIMDSLLCDRLGLNNSFFMDVYLDAESSIGAPDLNECYTFTPPLNLWGQRDKSTVRRANLKEELMILSQL
jgi:hypothetical protein